MNTIFNVSSKKNFLRRWAGQFNLTVVNIHGSLGLAPVKRAASSTVIVVFHYTPDATGSKKFDEYYKYLRSCGLFNRKHEHVDHPLYPYKNGSRLATTSVSNAAQYASP